MNRLRPPLNWKLPLLLYAATWLTTTGFRLDNDIVYRLFLASILSVFNGHLAADAWMALGRILYGGLAYSVPLMFILTCHELGHYIQTRRYRVRSSLPYFIPMPLGPFGTLGAVIAMDGRIPNPRALFDIGISGPLAGLVPTVFCLYYGIKWSYFGPLTSGSEMLFGEPILFKAFSYWFFGPTPPDVILYAHPLAMAGWVGLLLTSLNLMPFSQLDGGHVFYALLGRRAARYSWLIFYSIVVLIVWYQLWHWMLILFLISFIGVTHPPTANDTITLNPSRRVLGWCTLAFIFFGLTPTPISLNESPATTRSTKIYCYQESRDVERTEHHEST